MPIFGFYCEKCDKEVEVIESREEANNDHKCEECGNNMVRLIGTGIGFKFRGTGFYCTDYVTKKNGDIH